MKTKFLHLAAILVAFGFAFKALALDVSQLTAEHPSATPSVTFFSAPKTETFEEILSNEKNKKFEDLGTRQGFGYTSDAVWLRTEIENNGTGPRNVLVESPYPTHAYVDFYSVADGTLEQHAEAGQLRPALQSAPIAASSLFALTLAPRSKREVYIRIESTSSLSAKLLIWDRAAFEARLSLQRNLQCLFYGGMIALAIYNLFLAMTTRDRVYLKYVLYIAGSAFTFATWNKIGKAFYPESYHHFEEFLYPVSFNVTFLAAIWFAAEFLELKQRMPRLLKIMQAAAVVSLVNTTARFFFTVSFRTAIDAVVVFSSLIALIIASVYWSLRGVREAKVYLFAWSVFLTSICYIILGNFGVVALPTYALEIPQLGAFFEALVFSIGLGDKINQERKAKQRAQLEMIESLARTNSQLSDIVNSGKDITANSTLVAIERCLRKAIEKRLEKELAVKLTFSHVCFPSEDLKAGFYEVASDGGPWVGLASTTDLDTDFFLVDPLNGEILAKIFLPESSHALDNETKSCLQIYFQHASSALSTVRLQHSLDLLDATTLEMRGIFEIINQGIFTIGESLHLRKHYSPELERILGRRELAGVHILDIISAKTSFTEEEIERINGVLGMSLGYDKIVFETQKKHLPQEFTLETKAGDPRTIEIDWMPILVADSEIVDKYLVTLKDVTEYRLFKKKSEEALESLKLIGEIVECGRDHFLDFLDFAQRSIVRMKKAITAVPPDLIGLKNSLHTLKGNARICGLAIFARVIHDVESSVSQGQPEDLEHFHALITDIHAKYQQVAFEKLHFSQTRIRQPVRFSILISHLHGLVERMQTQNNSHYTLKIDAPNDVIFSNSLYGVFESALVQLVTNSVDHGLQKQKGDLQLTVKTDGEAIVVTLKDSGNGLNLEAIAKRAVELKLVPATNRLSDEQIAEFIFSPELSTATSVTETSGRGFGLSSVRAQLDEVGGSVAVRFTSPERQNGHRKFEFIVTLQTAR